MENNNTMWDRSFITNFLGLLLENTLSGNPEKYEDEETREKIYNIISASCVTGKITDFTDYSINVSK